MQRLRLTQQIAQLEDAAPADFDPEDDYGGQGNNHKNVDDDGDVQVDAIDPNAGREHYVEVGPSALRKLRDSVVDPKYDGVKTSRRTLMADENEEDEEETSIPSMHGGSSPSASHDGASQSEEEEPIVHKGQKRVAEDNDEAQANDNDLLPSLQRTRVADKLKGQAISRQLRIWDSLVDGRIRLQKTLTSTNKLPHPQKIGPYISNPDNQDALRRFLSEALLLSEDIFELRQKLLEKAGSTPPPRKRQRTAVDFHADGADWEALLKESTEEMMWFDAQTHGDILSNLQKWSAKVQAVSPAALFSSTRTSFKSGPSHVKSAGELVEEALRDRAKIIKKTWTKSTRIGSKPYDHHNEEDEEGDEETFDDRDFYQAMLRDVIETKGGKDAAAEFYANSKKQKKKKAVDTRASKGRKLRYEPHEKLQNFMVPIPIRGGWHEEQIDELFSSLLGKGFEDASQTTPTDSTEIQQENASLQGLRIFG
ncbi:apoptosis-antagonizing transcription factor [Hysterangium stoloniferum]|nr:apoptosis-antagonizing transcription factor [Hysterangium stoloniferum]